MGTNHSPSNLFVGYRDAIVALHNVEVAAEGLGLGTVYVGMVLSAELSAVLGRPEYVLPAGMLPVGYPEEEPELGPRPPLEAVVHRNGYHVPADTRCARSLVRGMANGRGCPRPGGSAWRSVASTTWPGAPPWGTIRGALSAGRARAFSGTSRSPLTLPSPPRGRG